MAKNLKFNFPQFPQFQTLISPSQFRPFSNFPEDHHLKSTAIQICEVIRTKPRWEKTLISQFPSIDFSNPKLFTEVLKIEKNVFYSFRLFNWLISQSGVSFLPDPTSSKLLFNSLLKGNASVLAFSLFESLNLGVRCLEKLIVCLCDDGFVDEAFSLFVKFRSLLVCRGVMIWNVALAGSVRVRRTDILWKLYEEMVGCGVSANFETVGYLIEAYCIDGKVNEGYELLRQVEGGRVGNGSVAVNNLVCGLSLSGNFDKVSEILHRMIVSENNPDVYTYQGIIYGLCKRGNVVEGYRVFNDLKDRGYALDRVMYTTMIDGLCKMRELGEARKLWFEMIRKGMSPNEYTYNVIIDGYFRIHAVDEALKMHNEMQVRGCKLNFVTYNTMLDGLRKNGRISEACSLFEEMVVYGIVPDVISYNIMIAGFCSKGDWAKGEVFFQELVANGLQPSNLSYTPLIEQFCLVGRTKQALVLWTDMMNKGVEASSFIHECLICGLCKEGLPIEGLQWLSEMMNRRVIPKRKTFETLINSLLEHNHLEDALRLVNSMLHAGHTLQKFLNRALVSKFCSNSFDLVEEHIQNAMSSSQVSVVCS